MAFILPILAELPDKNIEFILKNTSKKSSVL